MFSSPLEESFLELSLKNSKKVGPETNGLVSVFIEATSICLFKYLKNNEVKNLSYKQSYQKTDLIILYRPLNKTQYLVRLYLYATFFSHFK